MEKLTEEPTTKGPAEMSTGDVWLDVVCRGGEVLEMRAGDTVHTAPREWHWHGATPDHLMAHLAIWEGTGDPDAPESTWGDHVTDQEYAGQPSRREGSS